MDTEQESLELSRLDQTILRVYVRQLLVFPFTEHTPTTKADAHAVLTTSLLVTLRQYPFLAGTIKVNNTETGELTVDYPSNIDLNLASRMLTVKDVDLSSLEFEKLCKDGVPPFRLPADILCPSILVSHPGLDDQYAEVLTTFAKGSPLPVFASQINYVPGGLILSVFTHHSIVDGTGIAKIYGTWSEHTRNCSNGMPLPAQIQATDLNNAQRALNLLAEDAQARKLPEFRYPGDRVGPVLRDVPYGLNAKLLVFSAQIVADLATSLSPLTGERISSFTALCTPVWCHVTNARRKAMTDKGLDKTTLGIAIDHRKRVGTLLPNDYIGNCANGLIVPVPLSSIPTSETMSAETMAPVALALFGALGEIDLDWFKARLSELLKR